MEKYFHNFKGFFNPNWLNTWRPYFYFFVFVFIIFGQTLTFERTNFDDNLLTEKQEIFNNFENVATIFSTDAFFSIIKVYYRPILNLTYLFDASISGSKIFFYHFGNLWLHFLAVCLIFYFFKKITGKPPLSFVLSLFFLIHPALVQAVAWLPGRNDSILTIFVVAAVLCFMKFSSERKLIPFLGYSVFLFLALLTKEVAIFLPLLIIFYFFTVGKQDKLSLSDKSLVIFVSGAVVFIWFLMRKLALEGGAPPDLNLIKNNIPMALVMSFKMFSQAIFPVNLAVLNFEPDSSFIYSLIVLPIFISAIIFSRQKRKEYITFGIFWFLLFFFVPFLFSEASTYLSHRLYLPLVGIFIVLSEIDWVKNLDWHKKSVKAVTIILLAIISISAYKYSLNFKNPLIFWQSALKSSPHSFVVHNNLGAVYLEKNNLEEAKKEFELVLKITPNFYKAWSALGDIYLLQKQPDKAIKCWQNAIKINPLDVVSAAKINNLNKN